MALTLSGWAAIPTRANPALIEVPIPGTGKSIVTTKFLAPLWVSVLLDIHTHIIPISGGYGPDCWVYRPPRLGSSSGRLSNHAGACAVDVRYDVFKADHKRHATAKQIVAAHAILDHYRTSRGKRILGWGGDWKVGKSCDEMHWEIGQAWEPGIGSPVTTTDVKDVIARLGLTVNGPKKPVKVPTKVPARHTVVFPGRFGPGAKGAYVTELQKHLVALHYHLSVDGVFGPQTKSAVVDVQRRNRKLGTADGWVGPMTCKTITGHA